MCQELLWFWLKNWLQGGIIVRSSIGTGGGKNDVDKERILRISPDNDKSAFLSLAIDFSRKNAIEYIINQDNYHTEIVRFLKIAKTDGAKVVNVLHIAPDFHLHIKLKGVKTKIKDLVYRMLYGKGILLKQRCDMAAMADKFVLLSPSYIEPFMNTYNVNVREKLCAIPNPAPLDYYDASFENKKNEVLIVSRIEDNQKRITTALRIWQQIEKRFPEWHLVLAGYGNDETKVLDYAKKLELNRFHFIGRTNDPRPLYASASIFMMTSCYEGFPMTLLESMQFGCVPIAFNSFSSIQDLIEKGKNGFLVQNGNEEDFISKLSMLMNDKRQRQRISEQAVSTSQNFTIEKVVDKWEQLFKDL